MPKPRFQKRKHFDEEMFFVVGGVLQRWLWHFIKVFPPPLHIKQLGIVFVWFRAISLLRAFSTVCFIITLLVNGMLYFTKTHKKHWGFVFHTTHKVKLDFRLPFFVFGLCFAWSSFFFMLVVDLFSYCILFSFFIICCISLPNIPGAYVSRLVEIVFVLCKPKWLLEMSELN